MNYETHFLISWCNTNFPRELCKAAQAHAVQNQIEAAYRRSDLFEKWHDLMMQWGKDLASS